jgi:hypothetical protein
MEFCAEWPGRARPTSSLIFPARAAMIGFGACSAGHGISSPDLAAPESRRLAPSRRTLINGGRHPSSRPSRSSIR